MNKVIDKCKKVLNIMRCLAGTERGAYMASIRQIYVCLIRSRMEYGCLVYGSAYKSALAWLDLIQSGSRRNAI